MQMRGTRDCIRRSAVSRRCGSLAVSLSSKCLHAFTPPGLALAIAQIAQILNRPEDFREPQQPVLIGWRRQVAEVTAGGILISLPGRVRSEPRAGSRTGVMPE
jgi:hypothetical protein